MKKGIGEEPGLRVTEGGTGVGSDCMKPWRHVFVMQRSWTWVPQHCCCYCCIEVPMVPKQAVAVAVAGIACSEEPMVMRSAR
jgi:hypothetical protein